MAAGVKSSVDRRRVTMSAGSHGRVCLASLSR